MTAPFLVIGEIELHLRWLIDRLDLTDLAMPAAAAAPTDGPTKASDMTMGEIERILQAPGQWERVGMKYDRVTFCRALEQARKFRNDTMHFGDPLTSEELDTLRAFADALRVACAAAAKRV